MNTRYGLLVGLLVIVAVAATAADKIQPAYVGGPGHGGPDPVQNTRTDFVFASFEAEFPPLGWTRLTSGAAYPWVQSDATAYFGDYSAYVQWGSPGQFQDEWLVTPAIDASGLTFLYVEFFETGNYWSYYGLTHEVLVSTTVPGDPAAFTAVAVFTPSTYTAPWLDSSGSAWGLVEVDLSAYVGQPVVYVALRYTGDYADDWWVDGVRVFEPNEHDVKALAALPDGETWLAGTVVTPQLVVKNVGQNPETFDVSMAIAATGVPFYAETMAVADLAPGGERTVDFTPFAAMAGNYYDLTGTTLLVGDDDPANDVATAHNDCFSGERTPLGIFITNWGCGPCVQANQALDAYVPTQGNEIALLRVHCWWPASNDPMYLANVEQCDFLIEGTPTGADYAPHLWLDNYVDAGSEGVGYAGFFEAQKAVAAPLEVGYLSYLTESQQLLVLLDVLDPLAPTGDYRLFVTVTEDNVAAQGPNGEPIHNQVFRWLYPDTGGLAIDTAVGTHDYLVDIPLNPGWVFENLRGTVYVQDLTTGKVLNAGTIVLEEGSVAIEDPDEPEDEVPTPAFALLGAHPNPFNPLTKVSFSLDRPQAVRLAVYDLNGRLVCELADDVFTAGVHDVTWQGRDAAGYDVASGTYVVRMITDQAVRSSKMMLVR